MSNSMFDMMMAKRYYDEQEARKRELAERQKAMAKKQNADSLKSMASNEAIKYAERKMADKAATSAANTINSGVISNAGNNALTNAVGSNVSGIANSGGNAIKDAVSNNISNATTNAGNLSSGLATGAGGAVGGAAGGMAGQFVGDKLGLGETGTEISKGVGSIAGSLGGQALMNTALSGLTSAGTTAGAGTAAGLAGAAGTAGAGAASTGLMAAAGPVGIALAAGKMIYDIVKSVKQKQAMKAMQKAQTANAQADQETTQNAMANIAEQAQQTNEQLASQQPVDPSTMPSTINGYQKYMEDQGYSPEAVTGVSQGLNYGDKNVANWIDNYNQNNPDDIIAKPTNESEVDLARAGELNKDSFGDVVSDIMGQVKQGYTNGADYKEINPYDKTGWNRVGRAAGIVESILANPYVQGTVAGIAYGKDKGDALYGLGQGWNWAQNKAKSDTYAKAMGMRPSVLGGVSTDDYKAKATIENAIARTNAYASNVNDQIENRYYKRQMDEKNFEHKKEIDNKKLSIAAKQLGISEEKLKELIRMNDNKIKASKTMTPYQKAKIIQIAAGLQDEEDIDAINALLDEDEMMNYGL